MSNNSIVEQYIELNYVARMARRPVKTKKLPSEYPTFAFRVSSERKKQLNTLIKKTQSLLNSDRSEGDSFWNKNDVIFSALEVGLRHLQQKKPKNQFGAK